jgi:hypothetical protein
MTTSGPPWQLPQPFESATAYEIRDELGDLVARDLLGPWAGEIEDLPPQSSGPRDRYLVGALGPRRTETMDGPTVVADASQAVDVGLGGDFDGDAGLPDVLSPQALGRIWASSIGLSFAIGTDRDRLSVEVSWGQYDKAEREAEGGKKQRVWSRHPYTRQVEVRTDVARSREWLVGGPASEFGVWLDVQVRQRGPRRVVRVALVNGHAEPPDQKDTAWLFQTSIRVRALDGIAAVFEAIGDPLVRGIAPGLDGEEAHLELLYRDTLRHAFGHNVAVHAAVRTGERSAWELSTTWLPSHDVPQVQARTAGVTGLVASMDALAELSNGDGARLAASLKPLLDGYGAWLDEQAARARNLPESLRRPAKAAVQRARVVAERIGAGVELLRQNPQARRAFGFANRAMALQRRNTVAAGLRATEGLSYQDAFTKVVGRGASEASWRPFQLGFLLINLVSLTDPAHPERGDLVDLLFFPTGGGKTEAYLGLAAYTFAIRRLQRVVGSGDQARDGGAGVAVLMRYTLRLLTAQQFQRAAALVCAAEVLRREDQDTWGADPFRIGLWVGASVSPNWFEDDRADVSEARESAGKTRSLQILACPWCGADLRGDRDQVEDPNRRLVITYCPEGEGQQACPFSLRRAPGRGLPVLTVDEYLYRTPPTLLIATVDKLAQLPWYGFAGMLFGRVSRRCPRHGYRHPDLDTKIGCGERHHAAGALPRVESEPVTRLRPPDLIIQDELHLISGALGTVVGLFENAVDELCMWAVDGRRAGPKTIASTATTKRAREQVRALYARDLSIFPPPVLNASDTFFSAEVPVGQAHPGRRYLGICAHGTRLKSAEIRLAEILLIAGQTMFDRYGPVADPYMTLVGYFNAIRELAGMRRYLDDDVATRVRRNGVRRGLSNRDSVGGLLTIRELTSRINSADITGVLKEIEEQFDPERHTSTRRSQFLAEAADARKSKREPVLPDGWGRPAVDVVLATSMLQVGVDLGRLGLMIVTGQPKNTAEYIQASSRVGRSDVGPGLVVTLYNWARPRDLAHYEDFEHYHATFYRRVEALSVTPYSRRALDRGTTATFVAAIRNATEAYSVNAAAHDVDLDGAVVTAVTAQMLARAERAVGQRGSTYFREKIAALKDRWNAQRERSARLGYEQRRQAGQQLVGLLEAAGDGPWTDLTVGRSMRETENEVNVLLPGTGLFDPPNGAPPWSFNPPTAATDDGVDDDDLGVIPAAARAATP